MHVIVIGAGVIGASIAWHLRRHGTEVTVINGGGPAASDTSFGWINASFFADEAHHHLRVAGMEAYERLMQAVPTLPIDCSGALWWEDQGSALRAFHDMLSGLGYPVEILDKGSLLRHAPSLRNPPHEALLFPGEMAADAGKLAGVLLDASGARVVRGIRVTGIVVDSAVRGVDTETGFLPADRVVVAAGTGAADILSSVDVPLPMLRRPGVLVATQSVAARIGPILVTPHGEVRQLPDGRLLASAVAGHQGDATEIVTETADDIAVRVLTWLEPMIDGGTLSCQSVALAHRPMPQDGLPVIGPAGPTGVHVAVMHSGVTLAAITGEITAAEVLGQATNAQTDLVAPYRPDRFQ